MNIKELPLLKAQPLFRLLCVWMEPLQLVVRELYTREETIGPPDTESKRSADDMTSCSVE